MFFCMSCRAAEFPSVMTLSDANSAAVRPQIPFLKKKTKSNWARNDVRSRKEKRESKEEVEKGRSRGEKDKERKETLGEDAQRKKARHCNYHCQFFIPAPAPSSITDFPWKIALFAIMNLHNSNEAGQICRKRGDQEQNWRDGQRRRSRGETGSRINKQRDWAEMNESCTIKPVLSKEGSHPIYTKIIKWHNLWPLCLSGSWRWVRVCRMFACTYLEICVRVYVCVCMVYVHACALVCNCVPHLRSFVESPSVSQVDVFAVVRCCCCMHLRFEATECKDYWGERLHVHRIGRCMEEGEVTERRRSCWGCLRCVACLVCGNAPKKFCDCTKGASAFTHAHCSTRAHPAAHSCVHFLRSSANEHKLSDWFGRVGAQSCTCVSCKQYSQCLSVGIKVCACTHLHKLVHDIHTCVHARGANTTCTAHNATRMIHTQKAQEWRCRWYTRSLHMVMRWFSPLPLFIVECMELPLPQVIMMCKW